MPARVAKQERCAEGLSVKTMLCDRTIGRGATGSRVRGAIWNIKFEFIRAKVSQPNRHAIFRDAFHNERSRVVIGIVRVNDCTGIANPRMACNTG